MSIVVRFICYGSGPRLENFSYPIVTELFEWFFWLPRTFRRLLEAEEGCEGTGLRSPSYITSDESDFSVLDISSNVQSTDIVYFGVECNSISSGFCFICWRFHPILITFSITVIVGFHRTLRKKDIVRSKIVAFGRVVYHSALKHHGWRTWNCGEFLNWRKRYVNVLSSHAANMAWQGQNEEK